MRPRFAAALSVLAVGAFAAGGFSWLLASPDGQSADAHEDRLTRQLDHPATLVRLEDPAVRAGSTLERPRSSWSTRDARGTHDLGIVAAALGTAALLVCAGRVLAYGHRGHRPARGAHLEARAPPGLRFA